MAPQSSDWAADGCPVQKRSPKSAAEPCANATFVHQGDLDDVVEDVASSLVVRFCEDLDGPSFGLPEQAAGIRNAIRLLNGVKILFLLGVIAVGAITIAVVAYFLLLFVVWTNF